MSEPTGRSRERLEDLFVVDADVHLHEDPAQLAEFAEPPWDVALREIAKVEERYLDLPGLSPRAEYRIPWPGGSNRPQTVWSAASMRRELDDLHVDVAVLFPDHLLSLAMVREPAFAVGVARAYNDWLAERWLREEPSLKGAVVVPPQDPAAGAAEIRKHAGNPGVVCAYLPAAGLKVLYGNECYDPVYDAAQEAGLPVAIHSVEAVYPVFPFQLEQFRTAMAVHALAHPLAMVANLVSMLETGVPVRFPQLGIAFMEAGTGWIPWLANRLDKEYVERRREVPILSERPSHYMQRFSYGTQPIEEPERRGDIVRLFELFDGENRALYASDWPHHDFDHTQFVFGLPFSPEARRKIMGLNAARFFGIEPPA
ncbi:MAG TPA: amidohydrolase family protein [Gaiellaceae bacterium]|jgi:predicted TIM-barrel fold metal-dependent hydrolase